ncbi:hypothetical protein EJ06DRAFT_549540 [Trichodelitschia bisporula]|uniref:Uncharacterized protein n=1 Tax=Trichodelitschia bisporula TaxID=703511 RepID=A0A6G1HU26_9PEZI|nr:hypothetical protein EJ06DRAFT_549540 [Trichodelitschia bisporula]
MNNNQPEIIEAEDYTEEQQAALQAYVSQLARVERLNEASGAYLAHHRPDSEPCIFKTDEELEADRMLYTSEESRRELNKVWNSFWDPAAQQSSGATPLERFRACSPTDSPQPWLDRTYMKDHGIEQGDPNTVQERWLDGAHVEYSRAGEGLGEAVADGKQRVRRQTRLAKRTLNGSRKKE